MRILYITVSISAYNTGDTIYSYGIIDRLAECATVDVLTYLTPVDKSYSYYFDRLKNKVNKIYEAEMSTIDKAVKFFKYRMTFVRYSSSMHQKVKELIATSEYDVVVFDHLRMAFTIEEAKKAGCYVVLIQHNVETANYKEESKIKGKQVYKLKNIGLPAFEKKCMEQADTIWCITESDKTYFKSLPYISEKHMSVVVPYFPYQRIKKDYVKAKKLVITGTMSWYPNVEGVEWFVKRVFSKLHEQDPEYKLWIVGRNPDERILKLASESVIITGSVPSVDKYLVESDLLIVPNKLGGGAKIKIMEGIFKGIPAVVLRPSITGYETMIPDEAFVVNNEVDYLNAITTINDNENRKKYFVDRFIENAKRDTDISEIVNQIPR